ncbi:hypothetical protein [Pseudarthrobacter sp. S6]|uniref:hypothetical protein n=1 Tax=Pseudarthrobacter sp. S6 TaxID=3418420 RepID=UPI003CECC0DA
MAQNDVVHEEPKTPFKYKAGTVQVFLGAVLLLAAAAIGSMRPETGAILAWFLVILIGVSFCATGIFRRVRR